MRGLPRSFGSFPFEALAEAMRGPGTDTREWASYGTVEASQVVDGQTLESVEFDTDGMGPLVNVRLHPRNISVRCRVASSIAGNGEGSYQPFVEGDEVLVIIPGGYEVSGCVIIGRLNNTVDKFPTSAIAGQDPTKNTFAFERRRALFIQEYASTYMLRVASHGAFFLIAADSGAITLRDGSKGALQMGPDLFGYMEGTREVGTDTPAQPKAVFQLDLTGRRATLQVDDAMLLLNSSQADSQPGNCFLISPAQATVQCGTNQPNEHVATIEGVVNIVEKAVVAIGALLVPPLAPAAANALTAGIVAAALLPIDTLTVAPALALALQAMALVPKGAVDATGVQTKPMLGAAMFKTG